GGGGGAGRGGGMGWFTGALAGGSPRAGLYSLVPRSSACPSIRTGWLGFPLTHGELVSSTVAASEPISARSNAKWMSFNSTAATNSRGDGPRPIPGPPRPDRESGPIPMAAPPLPPYADSLETPACAEPD